MCELIMFYIASLFKQCYTLEDVGVSVTVQHVHK